MRGLPERSSLAIILAALLAVAGMTGAALAAASIARNDAENSHRAFERSADQIASTLKLAIEHEQDRVVNAAAYVAANPDGSNTEFVRWANSVRVLDRYPELQGVGKVVIVPAAELAAFAARITLDPPHPLGPDGKFQVVPAGSRPFYCFGVASLSRASEGVPAGLDFCASNVSSLAARPQVVLDRALEGHQCTAVALEYDKGTSNAVFRSGGQPHGAARTAVDLGGGWRVEGFAALPPAGMPADRGALAALLGGLVVSAILGVLVFVLGTGRARALRLVQVRTAELRGAEAQLVETARRAGMAEIATNVLHNVGNGLNSVNVSVNLVSQKVRGSRSPGLTHAVALMRAHRDDLGDFLTTDDRGRQLPDYLDKLATTLQSERESLDDELLRLTQGVSYVKEIVNAQQSLAGVTSVIEPVLLTELADTALRMAGVLADDAVTVARELPDGPPLSLDRHRLLLVLLNLLSNATRAMARNDDRPSLLTLRAEITTDPQGPAVSLRVTDNGEGISAENLTQIFVHGFTTHDDGHGFGLHSAALAAQEMGGTLTAHSAGPGTGAAFTLEVPLERPGASS